MGRNVEHHPVRPLVFFLKKAGGCGFRAALAVIRAGLLQPKACFIYVLNPKTKVVQAKDGAQTVMPIRRLRRLETQYGYVDCPVAQIHALG